jgi:uncharacterized protein YPO0396
MRLFEGWKSERPVEPTAVEPVVVEPVAVEPAAVEPAAVEPTAVELIDVPAEDVEVEDRTEDPEAGHGVAAEDVPAPVEGIPAPAEDVPAPAERTAKQQVLLASVQWRAEAFQMVNWGGFDGHHVVPFDPGNTLLTGASGSGKSTLLDGYLALMMPSDTPFNGASNDATSGRARSAEQRNLLSYLRGKTDTTNTDGREVDKVLRGRGLATWGAIAMTFAGDDGRRFTAMRIYYVPARATRAAEITMRMCTVEGAIDLSTIEALVAAGSGAGDQRFAPKLLEQTYLTLRHHKTYSQFADTLFTRLGIGANGDGDKALRLLVRIQAGHQIRTVDELYKEMVLERPVTYLAADQAIAHFDDLEEAYLAMVTEQRKSDLLAPIVERHATLLSARAELQTLDTLGVSRDEQRTPISLWAHRGELRLLADAVRTNRSTHREKSSRHTTVSGRVVDLKLDLGRLQDTHRDAGGSTVERIDSEIVKAEVERDRRAERRDTLIEATAALSAALATREDFDVLARDAYRFTTGYDDAETTLQRRRDGIQKVSYPLQSQLADLREDRRSLQGRQSRVPRQLDDIRRTVARAVGLPPSALPFVAELIDVAGDQAQWRVAIETVLSGFARTLLVPLDRLEEFSRTINPLQLRGRLSFEGVPTADHRLRPADPQRIAGKLQYRDSPFSTWVQEQVSAPGRNALCVEGPDQLTGHDLRVTLTGQTRSGRRGSHGRSEAASIIGFSNEDALAEIDRRMEDVEGQLTSLTRQLAETDQERTQLLRQRDAYAAVSNYTWDDIDAGAVSARIRALQESREQALTGNTQLNDLRQRIAEHTRRLDDLQRTMFEIEADLKHLDERHGRLVDRQDQVTDELDLLEDDPTIELDDEQSAHLDQAFAAAAAPRDPQDLDEFGFSLARLRSRLMEKIEDARSTAQRAAADLETTFAQYQAQWEDPNLGRGLASYPDYARILKNIGATGLPERRSEWRQRLTEWSGQDLVPLSGALDSAVDDIDDRLVPINAILDSLPFGAGRDRLRIRLRKLSADSVIGFRAELRRLSTTTTRGVSDEQMEQRFRELQRFMATIRRRDDPRAAPELAASQDRDNLLDVRRHVEITAERYGPDGVLLSTYSSLGGKSGGESQELVAFIVGAALRFRLGDELRHQPRFAPVFLDEGFVKADSEFASRAVSAWRGLGFQLIVGAPLDKVTGLEPLMDSMLCITKQVATGMSYVDRIQPTAPDDSSRPVASEATTDSRGPAAVLG